MVGGGTVQGFWCCFTDELNQTSVLSVVQAKDKLFLFCTSLTGSYISLKLHMCFVWSKVLLREMSRNTSGHKMSQVDCLITSSILFRKILKAAYDTFGNCLLLF